MFWGDIEEDKWSEIVRRTVIRGKVKMKTRERAELHWRHRTVLCKKSLAFIFNQTLAKSNDAFLTVRFSHLACRYDLDVPIIKQ
jgi:hypothetical protein